MSRSPVRISACPPACASTDASEPSRSSASRSVTASRAQPKAPNSSGARSNCHAREAPTYQDSFHGQATALGSMKAARCSDCHTPHLNLPKADQKSSVNPANVMIWAGDCECPNSVPNAAIATNEIRIVYLRSSHSTTYPPST